VERLSDGTFLVIEGTIGVTGSAARLSGTLTGGGLGHWGSRFPDVGILMETCNAPQPAITLTPR
jgi:hypothetical protein